MVGHKVKIEIGHNSCAQHWPGVVLNEIGQVGHKVKIEIAHNSCAQHWPGVVLNEIGHGGS